MVPKEFPSFHFFESKYEKQMSTFQAGVRPQSDAEDVT